MVDALPVIGTGLLGAEVDSEEVLPVVVVLVADWGMFLAATVASNNGDVLRVGAIDALSAVMFMVEITGGVEDSSVTVDTTRRGRW